MARSTKEAWLAPDAGDLKEAEVVVDVPEKGDAVKVRALSATAANGATSQAITTFEDKGQQRMKVDSVMLDILRFQAGVVEPTFSTEEVRQISNRFGATFNKVVSKIVELSGLNEATAADTDARFPSVGADQAGENGTSPAEGDARSPDAVRAGPATRAHG